MSAQAGAESASTSDAWRKHAACLGANPNIFHPTRGDHPDRNENSVCDNGEQAKRICSTCPVQAECLQAALDDPKQLGIAGGKSERQRRLILEQRDARRGQGGPQRKPIDHGAPGAGGYLAHLRRGEQPCIPCSEARRVYRAEAREPQAKVPA